MKLARCLEKGCINFTYGKIYTAVPHSLRGKTKQQVNFRVEDDERDYYTIAETVDNIHKKWEWVN